MAKLQAALGKRLGIAQRKAEFQQVHAANVHRVKAHQKLFHRQPIMRTNRHFDHNIGNEGNRALNRVKRTSMLGRKSLIAIELHAKANLVQAAIAQLCQTRIVKKIAARVKARVRLRVQLARRIEKRIHIAFEQQRLATGNRQAIEAGTRGVRLAQLTRYVALMRKPILVVFLIGIEAEVAMPRALERGEERRRSLACAACNARR